jgi:L-ascorbate metabolism protein UlaG (beta-lactamase superfamily)
VQLTSGAKLLVDPWLVGTLSFGETQWLLEASKYLPPDIDAVLQGVDAILITQNLDDHCHLPTLKALPKTLPIIAQPDAAETARGLGFTSVQALDHGDKVSDN